MRNNERVLICVAIQLSIKMPHVQNIVAMINKRHIRFPEPRQRPSANSSKRNP